MHTFWKEPGTAGIPRWAVPWLTLAAMALGVLFLGTRAYHTPIPYQQAVAYTGSLLRYEVEKNYHTLHFSDGTTHEVYPHTEDYQFHDQLEALPPDTVLHLRINPRTNYVVEIRTDTRELLNFDQAQQHIYRYQIGYMVIGIVLEVAGLFMLWFVLAEWRHHRRSEQSSNPNGHGYTPLRQADQRRCRVLLQARAEDYHIVYRRVKTTNELVVNGQVYDQYRSFLEFSHALTANVDGHTIEAGYDESDSRSYILFDGARIRSKKRLI